MEMNTYLWIEDRKGKSGYVFWRTLMHELCPDVIVESKKNNSELIKAVKDLGDKKDRYIIVLDNSFDNQQVYQERKALKRFVDKRNNMVMLDIICFEYILLEFKYLIDWIYAPEDEFRIKRANAISARKKLVESISSGALDYKAIREIIAYDDNLVNHNVEQLSAKLLFDLTRNTGFEVSKGNLGDCWTVSCCQWQVRQEDDQCGLDDTYLTISDKMKRIYEGTSLQRQFSHIGLEVQSC